MFVCARRIATRSTERLDRQMMIGYAVVVVLMTLASWGAFSGGSADEGYSDAGEEEEISPEARRGRLLRNVVIYRASAMLGVYSAARSSRKEFRKALAAAQSLTTEYIRVVQTPRAHFRPLSALSADKEDMKAALMLDAAYQASQGVLDTPIKEGSTGTLRDALITTYAMLADFVPDDLAERVNRYREMFRIAGEKVKSGEQIDGRALAEATSKFRPSEEDEKATQKAHDEYKALAAEMAAYLNRIAPRDTPSDERPT
jgi:hypothetical protein